MSENNGENTTNNGEQQEQLNGRAATPAAASENPTERIPDTFNNWNAAPANPAQPTPESQASTVQPTTPLPTAFSAPTPQQASTQAQHVAQPSAPYGAQTSHYAQQSSAQAPVPDPQAPAPQVQTPGSPYGVVAPASNAAPHNNYGVRTQPSQGSVPTQGAPYGVPVPPAPNQSSQGTPAPSSASSTATAQQQVNHESAQHQPNGHAGPGYPASNAYPSSLAPAVTARPRGKKKVGLGLFAGSVVAAALVGGLVAGGSMALLDQGSNDTASTTSQSAPLVVNNTNSVNEVTAAAAKASPSVVTISATSGSSGGTGSGIILDTEGHILTNTHVVTLDGAASDATIEVQTSDNKVYSAKVVGTDPLSDLAVIKIDAPDLVAATLGDSSKINVGDTVIAIGAPLGLNGTVTDGIVSTLNRTIQVASSAVPDTTGDTSQDDSGSGGEGFRFSPPGDQSQTTTSSDGTVNLNVIQTDAAINPGNSGGALVNTDGAIIGVNVAIASTDSSSSSSSQSGNIGVGFSIPIDHAKSVAEQIIKSGAATHGQLGVSVSATSSTDSSSAFSTGATVASVTADSAASKAGLKEGDVITQLGTRTISDPSELTAAVREQAGGTTVKVTFVRDGKTQTADVTLDTMPAS